MRWLARWAALALFISLAASARAAPGDGLETLVRNLQAMDVRVAAIAYRLSTANRELCDDIGPQWGLTLHSARQYGPRLRPIAMRLFGLRDAVAVSVVVPGGPAAAAGLRPADEILAIDGAALPAGPAPSERTAASYEQVGQAQAALAGVSAPAVLTIRRGAQTYAVRVTPQEGCAYDIQITPTEAINASADGSRVWITSGFVRWAADDDDLALVLGHEYAHNVLHHRAQLDQSGVLRSILGNLGSSPQALRRAEREADYAGLFLAARAGYDVSGAEQFWRRLRMTLGDRWYARWSHPAAREREAAAAATSAEIGALRAAGRPLRWDPSRLRQG